MRRSWQIPLILAVTSVVAIAAHAGVPVPPVVQAVEVTEAPKIDGVLDDECWKALPEITGFTDCVTRKPAFLQTIAKICYDQRNIYVAMRALHPDPSKLKADEKKRNGRLYGDDFVAVDIDSTHSHRNVSWFDVSAIGTQAESLEGGSATKIQWRGDWQGAAKIVDDGYNVEMAIPFSLLKYDKNQDTFGICFLRRMGREQIWTGWPDLNGTMDTNYYAHWVGLKLPSLKSAPVIMGYMLGNAGGGDSGRVYRGFDLKYAFSNDMLGLVSVKPDLSNVEQDVETVNFSYTERQLSDRRPFFQEWDLGTPSALFYSRRVPDFDLGTKFVGKAGPNTFGFLNARTVGDQSDTLLRYIRSVGDRSGVNFGLADHWVAGHRNTVSFYSGNLGWANGQRTHDIGGGIYSSNTTDRPGGGIRDLHYSTNGPDGSIGGSAYIGHMDADYNTELGYAPDLNQRGWDVSLYRDKDYRNRNLRYTGVSLDLQGWQHLDGTPFRKSFSISGDVGYQDGHSCWIGYSRSERDQFHDQSRNLGTSWNDNSYDMQGGTGFSWGRTAGGRSRSIWIEQAFRISRNLRLNSSLNRQSIQNPSPYAGIRRQVVNTLSYDLTAEKSIGGRIVQQLGQRNIYFVYRQQVRFGTDVFLIFGDPNAAETRGRVTLKLVRPL